MPRGNFQLADCVVRPSEHIIEGANGANHVEPRTMALLLLLVEHAGQVVPRQDIEERLWAGRVVGYDALTQTVTKLRRALGDDCREPRYLLTVPKEGYQLIAEVRDAAVVPPAAGPDGDAPEPPAPPSRRVWPRSWRPLAGIVLATLVAVLVGSWWSPPTLATRPPGETAATHRPAIAVMPFTNHNRDDAQAYVAEGLTEDLISSLTHFPELLVIAMNSTQSLRDKPIDIPQIRKTLGVRYVVLGSIQSEPGTLRVQAHLVDAEANLQMWSQKWDKPRGELFAIQDQIVDAIASRVLPHVQEAEKQRANRKPTASLDAYDLFQRARSEKHKLSPDGEARAAELLRQAIALDPNFAEAHALLGWANGIYRVLTGKGPSYEESLASVHRGLELNPQQSLGYQALAQVLTFMKRYEDAARAGLRGIEINPNDAENYIMYSRAASTAGWYKEAVASAERAIALNPLYPKWYPFIYSRALYADRQYQRAVDVCVDASTRQAYVATILTCVAALERLGRHTEAVNMLGTARAIAPSVTRALAIDSWGFRDEGLTRQFDGDLAAAGLPG